MALAKARRISLSATADGHADPRLCKPPNGGEFNWDSVQPSTVGSRPPITLIGTSLCDLVTRTLVRSQLRQTILKMTRFHAFDLLDTGAVQLPVERLAPFFLRGGAAFFSTEAAATFFGAICFRAG